MDERKNIKIFTQLDPVMETIGLLYISDHQADYKREWIESCNELGINGELFFEKHMGYLEDYLKEFEKHKVLSDEASFFINVNSNSKEMDLFFRVMFYGILNNHKWLNDFSNVTEEVILELMLELLAPKSNKHQEELTLYSVRTTDKFIAFLDECEASEREKWMLLQLYCQPKQMFERWINVISSNIQAYEKAFKAVESHFNKLMESYEDSLKTQKLSAYKNIVDGIQDELFVYPTLAFPNTLSLLKDTIYYGLLLDLIPIDNDSPEEIKEFLHIRLKALADMSKLQILMLLKQGEKYNLEIAEQIGLTAATTSHHMNALLATGFVGINKQAGKVYYHLEKEGIKHLIDKLEQYLL